MMQAGESTLRHLLDRSGMAGPLADERTTEVVVMRPGSFGVEQDGFWHWHEAPKLTYDVLEGIAILSARMAGLDVGGTILSRASKLPDGQRIKMVLPPAVPFGTISLTIRRRALNFKPTLDWLNDRDYFSLLNPAVDWVQYFQRDVIGEGKSIVVTGGIGDGKTTMAEALVRAIPLQLRVVTVEGSSELIDLPQRNWVPLFFDEDQPDSATKRIQDVMQMRPDFFCFQEVRGGEAWALLRALKIGIPTFTTIHSPGARKTLNSLESMVKQSEPGRGMESAEIMHQLRQYVRVVAHAKRFLPKNSGEKTKYRLTEVLEIGETPAEDRMVSAWDGSKALTNPEEGGLAC